MKTSPKNITELKKNEVFVFGSNLRGRHGAGAAKQALKWGAIEGKDEGHYGKTYALPTKNEFIETMPLNYIEWHVGEFIDHAAVNSEWIFLVTEIGCGLAGYTPKDIAPLFEEALDVENIHLPESFIDILIKKQ